LLRVKKEFLTWEQRLLWVQKVLFTGQQRLLLLKMEFLGGQQRVVCKIGGVLFREERIRRILELLEELD